MSNIFDGVDLTNPCEVWPKLEAVLYSFLAGEKVVRTRIGGEDVTFNVTGQEALENKIRQLKAECEAKQAGRKVRRRAICAGFRS